MSKVSVVIPAHNAAGTIERALDSVRRQSHQDMEVILVDDLSTDGTVEIAARHALAAELKLSIHAQGRNAGAAAARNAGWSLANGRFVAFLDADDAWHVDKLQRQIPIMEAGADISGHRTPVIDSEIRLGAELPRQVTSRQIRRHDILFRNPFHTSSVIIRRDLPLRFSEQLRRAEDYLLWCEVVLGGYRGVVVDPPLAFVFKPLYGHAGLSANLRAMQEGETAVYDYLYHARLVTRTMHRGLKTWSWMRHWRRVLINRLRTATR